MAKEKYWKVLEGEKPLYSLEAYSHKKGYILYKIFPYPNSPIGVWHLQDSSGSPLGAKSSTHRDITHPPKGWANGLIEQREKILKEKEPTTLLTTYSPFDMLSRWKYSLELSFRG